jgi:hypothetical protein
MDTKKHIRVNKLAAYIHAVLRAIKRGKNVEENDVKLLN